MSHSAYTASERRGMIIIAFLALLIIGGGMLMGLSGNSFGKEESVPIVEELPEMVDSISLNESKEKSSNKSLKKTKPSKDSKIKTKKNFKKRSPRDERVSFDQ